MSLLTVDYNVLMYIVIASFALTGFFRGWWREGLTTILVLLLVLFLTRPDTLTTIVDYINNMLEFSGILFETGGNLSTEAVQAASASAAEPPVTLDISNRNFYIILLIVLIALSI